MAMAVVMVITTTITTMITMEIIDSTQTFQSSGSSFRSWQLSGSYKLITWMQRNSERSLVSNSLRYHVIADEGSHGVLIFDSQTGAIQRPACWQDLDAYYYYLVGRHQIGVAQELLAESMAGNKPITKMLMKVNSGIS